MKNQIITIIPARGGSKGIPRKNLQKVGNQTLIQRSIDAAYSISNQVFVSTEDAEISNHVKETGKADVLERPLNLSEDNTLSEDVLLYHLQKEDFSNDSICVFMQCTSPFTKSNHLRDLVNCIDEDQFDSALFIKETYKKVYSSMKELEAEKIKRKISAPRQIRKPNIYGLGNAWAFRVGGFLENKYRLFGNVGSVVLTDPYDLEIDSQIELEMARLLVNLIDQ